MGITKTLTTAYQPQCDGQTERQNRALQHMLSSFVSSRKDNCDLWLGSAPFQSDESVVCLSREVDEFQVVDIAPHLVGNPRARPARLGQNIRPRDIRLS